MAPGVEDKGCSARTEETTQLDSLSPEQGRQAELARRPTSPKTNSRDTASEQDSAFKKENDATPPPPSGP